MESNATRYEAHLLHRGALWRGGMWRAAHSTAFLRWLPWFSRIEVQIILISEKLPSPDLESWG